MHTGKPQVGRTPFDRGLTGQVRNNASLIGRILLGVFVWLCFAKVPATTLGDDGAMSFEAVLSFGAAHHLQWGRDLIFTYGPLGVLISDYYWGEFFGLPLLWSFGFALLLTILFLRFSGRVLLPVRAALYLALPLLTLPSCFSLGFDPVYFCLITMIGIAAFPEEQAGMPLLAICGVALGVVSLIKFTFCLYSVFTLLVLSVVYCLGKRPRAMAVLLVSSTISFLAAWWLAGQTASNLPLYFRRSWQIASGYSSALAIAPADWALVLGILIMLCLAGLFWLYGRSAEDRWRQAGRLCLAGAGIFLAWKEGFMRADLHVILFMIYAFFMAALVPGLLRTPLAAQRRALPLTVAALVLCVIPFGVERTLFTGPTWARFLHKRADTLAALLTPGAYKRALERELDSRRKQALLPRIQAEAAGAPVGVLNYYQEVALLNGLDYRPHPAFQNLCCSTPELQQLNSAFYDSEQAPEYVLWRYGTIDQRFPTLDDGGIMLRMLGSYSPVVQEGMFVLWKRNIQGGSGYSLGSPTEKASSLEEWVHLPNQPVWLQLELHETWVGAISRFLCRGSMPLIDVQLEDGRVFRSRLPPGNAAAGFIVNPLLLTQADLMRLFTAPREALRVVAVRVQPDSRFHIDQSVRFVIRTIVGVPALQGGHSAS